MNKFKNLDKLPSFLAYPTGAAIAMFLTSNLPTEINDKIFTAAIFIGAFILISKIVEFIVQTILNRWQWLRKLILGSDFIEGWWIEYIKALENEETPDIDNDHFTVVSIYFRNGSYKIDGHLLSESGELKGSFNSSFSHYSESNLQYVFQGPWTGGSQAYTNHGYARISFVKDASDSHPHQFEGEVINIGPDFNRTFFTGKKLDKSKIPNRENKTIEEFAMALKNI